MKHLILIPMQTNPIEGVTVRVESIIACFETHVLHDEKERCEADCQSDHINKRKDFAAPEMSLSDLKIIGDHRQIIGLH